MYLDGKNLVWFTQNVVQNLIGLVLMSKSKRRRPEMPETKIVYKNVLLRLSEAEG